MYKRQGNTPCIFSRDFDNVNEQEYTASIENCGNFIYVQGAADDDGSPVSYTHLQGGVSIPIADLKPTAHWITEAKSSDDQKASAKNSEIGRAHV